MQEQPQQMPPVRSVHFRLDYIHAERLPIPHSPSQTLNIMFNVNVLSSNVSVHDTIVEIPFAVNISSMPSIVSISLRGALAIQFENSKDASDIAKMISEGKVPEPINVILMQYIMLEANILLRELGLPPMLAPIPQPPAQKPDKAMELHYA